MVVYTLKINSFPKIKAAFSGVDRDYQYSTRARAGQLEISVMNGIEYMINSNGYENEYRDGDIMIQMPDMGFVGKATTADEFTAASVIVEIDSYEYQQFDVCSHDDWEMMKNKSEGKVLIPQCVPRGKDANVIEACLNKIIINHLNDDVNSEMENIGIWCMIIARLDAYVRKTLDKLNVVDTDTNSAYMKKVKVYVDGHFADKIKLSDVAKNAKASESYIGKVIRKSTGKSFVEYVNHIRVENARKIFASDSKITAEHVAEMVGFCDGRYMNMVFKKLIGMNVRECRKMDAISLLK